MAWRKANTLTQLKFKRGATLTDLNDFTGCPFVFGDELSRVAADPYGATFSYSGLGSATEPYMIIQGASPGSFNLTPIFYSMTIGESIYIYRDIFGENVNIEFQKVSSTAFNVFVNYYNQRSGGSPFQISAETPGEGYVAWSAFALVVDDDNGVGTVCCVTNGTWYQAGLGERALRQDYCGFGFNVSPYTRVVYMLVTGQEVTPPTPSDDPYEDGGISTSGGGEGNFDDSSDVISLPSAPLLNLTLNHFISAYVPSITDINDLADWIWGNYDSFDATKILSKIFTNPMESILSLHMLPYTPASATAITVTIGAFATPVTMPPLVSQFEDIDCGSLTFDEYWGNYLDYNPFTKIQLQLPYIGSVDLDPDEVMGHTIKVLYRVDNLTGAFISFVYIDGDKILGQYSGNCILSVPVTAASYANLNAAILNIAATAAGAFGGAIGSAIGGGYGGMLAAKEGLRLGAGALGETLSSAAGNVHGMKVKITHSGGLTGTAGFLGAQKPYAIIHRPRQSVPAYFNHYAGYPSNITMQLSACNGFTSIRTMIYDGLPFTDMEIKELDEILKGGIFA